MNNRQAKQYARRLLIGYIESQFHANGSDPLCYDDHSDPNIEGRRLSKDDFARVCDTMGELYDNINRLCGDKDQNWQSHDVKADGKPGRKWKGYEDWQTKRGRI
jgi:hypothetical protein